MQQIKEVLRLHHEAKLAYSQIALACGLSKGVISKYLSLAKAQGIGWPLPEGMDGAQLESRLLTRTKRSGRFVEPDFPAIHQELKRKGVTKACRYDPQPNATYQELARHYGCAILPARPYKPKDKSKAEVGVQVVERWILARLRHHTFFSLSELNGAIRELLTELNARPFQRSCPAAARAPLRHWINPPSSPCRPPPTS